MFCPYCGKEANDGAVVCLGCGRSLVRAAATVRAPDASPKSRLVATLLAWFVGVFGVHRFYLGKTGTGVIMLFTLGGFGMWAFIDFILLVAGSMKDADGLRVTEWSIE